MTNQTIKKDPNNRGKSELERLLRSIWLGRRDSNIILEIRFKALTQ